MQNTKTLSNNLIIRSKEVMIRGLIWAFIGILYGILFVFFSVLADRWQEHIHPYFFAGILSGTLGALIYSSMRLSVLMAIVITPVASLLLLFSNTPMEPLRLIVLVGAVGGIIGILYGHYSTASRVHRADAKILAGFSSGFLASLVFLLIAGQNHLLTMTWVIGFMCPLTGWLYVLFVPHFIKYFDNLLPAEGDGALVGIGVSVFLALCIFVMMNSINTDTAGPYLPQIERIQASLPQAIVGGLLGGGLAGILSGLFFRRWQDL